MRHHFGITRIKTDIVLSVESVRAVITATEQHMGLGVVPAHPVQAALEHGEIARIASRRSPVFNHIAVVQLADKIPTVTGKGSIAHVGTLWRAESGAGR